MCTTTQIEGRDIEQGLIEARVSVSHPSAKGSITLFHGASPANANKLANSRVDLSVGAPVGDFNHRPGT